MSVPAASRACGALRSIAAWLDRAADALERPAARCLALEPVREALDADEILRDLRHRLFTRYY